MARTGHAETRTLTVSFPDAPALSEGAQAEEWARACGAHHTDIPVSGADLLSLLPQALEAQDQPTVDAVNTFVVARAARESGLTVALSGLGGDELFGGYPTFRDVPKARWVRACLGSLAVPAGRVVEFLSTVTARRTAKVGDMLTCSRDIAALYAARRRVFSIPQLAALAPGLDRDVLERAASPFSVPDGIEGADAVCFLDLSVYMRYQLLRDSDAMGMASSLEIRVPFLDNSFASLAWEAGAAARDQKRLFASALSDLLPNDILSRPKRGFTLPFREWLTDTLRDWVASHWALLPEVFDRRTAERFWKTFLAQPERVGWSRPWSLFCLAAYASRHDLAL
jgi:asparagine synthase (glutamine-hydrolysing)